VEFSPEYFPEDHDPDWSRMLRSYGVSVAAIHERSYMVAVDTLQDEVALSALIKGGLGLLRGDSVESIDPPREDALYGGFAVWSNGKLVVEPECCGRLSEVGGWIEATRLAGGTSMELWLGDDFVRVEARGDELHFEKRGFVAQRSELTRAVADGQRQIVDFGNRIQPIVAELLPEPAASVVVAQLIGRRTGDHVYW
jgi:hypothetical protein